MKATIQTMRSLKEIKGYVLGAHDGEIGRCNDFIFDDKNWTIRYIVADTRKWLPGRKVLISPISVGNSDEPTRTLNVALTKAQIKDSPPLDADAPVSRQYEIAFNEYYDWAYYWGGSALWGQHAYPRLLHRAQRKDGPDPESRITETTLRSCREVMGYHIHATDTDIGHVEDFIVDQENWAIRYLVIDTSNWLPASKRVLVSPAWVDLVDWGRREVLVNMTADRIKQSPEFDPSLPLNREYEQSLHDFYGRPYYW